MRANRRFAYHVQRLGTSNEADLLSSVTLECLEELKKGGTVDDAAVLRIVDRVAQRLVRQVRRTGIPLLEEVPAEPTILPGEIDTFIASLRQKLLALSPLHLELFDRCVVGTESVSRLSKESGLPRRTLTRRLGEIREAVRDLLRDRAGS